MLPNPAFRAPAASLDVVRGRRHNARVALRLVHDVGFDAAVAPHEPWLRALARRLTRSPADADDLLQDALERALRSWDRFEPGTNLRAWLSAIVSNLFIDRCRKRSGSVTVDLDDDLAHRVAEPVPDAEPTWAALGEAEVRAVLPQVQPEFRAVFQLHLEGFGYQDIAERLGIPRATVGTRLLRARRQLKDLLAPPQVTP